MTKNKKILYTDTTEVKSSGNGAVVYVPKKFIGKDATIIIEKEE